MSDADESAHMFDPATEFATEETYPGCEFENVTILRQTDKAVYLQMENGFQRWCPKAGIVPGSVLAPGERGRFMIMDWLRRLWNDEDPLADEIRRNAAEELKGVTIEGCVVLSDTPKALFVRVGTEEMWMPRTQVLATSECKEDGDCGTLVISRWIAEQKGLVKP